MMRPRRVLVAAFALAGCMSLHEATQEERAAPRDAAEGG
jgi:hypothetical protein